AREEVATALRPLRTVFFFSSRRRHTRCLSDWSSDVCSSDLKHRDSVKGINQRNVPADLSAAAKAAWDEAVRLGELYGYRNAQATVLAPTGTIGFMMDCDTTGVEPDIALVKYKKLVGGGLMKIVNQTVPMALSKLGYSAQQVKEIIEYIDENETIEGTPHIKDKDLPEFDCAFKPARGVRSIHYMGHIRTMGAVQPS